MHVHYNVRSIWICLLLQCHFAVFMSWTYLYTYIIVFYRAAYAMLIAARLPKDTDVSFITEMIEVCTLAF